MVKRLKKTKEQARAPFLMLLCAALWSLGGIFIKLIPWNPLVIAGWRSLLALLCVAAYMKFHHLKFRINKHSVWGGIFQALVFLLFVSANKLTTAANAIVLQYTAPVFILIISVLFLRQRIERRDIIAVICTLSGISLFFFDQLSPGNLLGNFVAIAAGLFFGCMMIVNNRADESGRMSSILLGHLFTALVGCPVGLFVETPITSTAVLSLLVLGIVQLGIPYILYGLAIKHCEPLVCSLLSTVEPLLNPVWVFLFDGETPGVFALLGGLIVIVTITAWCIIRDKALARSMTETAVQ